MIKLYGNKNYNTLDAYYKIKYGKKVAKISLNAGFSCPNKDGTKGIHGCSYCSKLGSGDNAGNISHSLETQFQEIKEIMQKKWSNTLYLPYLQANSNTYASIEKLKDIYERVLAIESQNTIGLAIATRPDCFNKEIYDYLGQLNEKWAISVELGLQTSNEQTAAHINRCSTNDEFEKAVYELRKRNIEVVVHIINGLPYETQKDMLATIDYLNQFDIQGLKIHSLLILRNTDLYKEYLHTPFPLLSLEEYVSICVKQIARLKPNVILHRLSADANIDDLVAPKWAQKKLVVMNEIDKLMRKKNIFQGDDYHR